MLPDEKPHIAEKEAPEEQDAPITKEEFRAQMQRITERAKAAGLNPVQMMIQTYADQGRAIGRGMLGVFLASLENADSPNASDRRVRELEAELAALKRK